MQPTAHRPDRKYWAMCLNKRILHLASFAKYTVAFFRMSRSSVTRMSSRFRRLISAACSVVFALQLVALKTASSRHKVNACLRLNAWKRLLMHSRVP